MQDRFSRTINYMRISVTDRCNLRCRYCMPEKVKHLPTSEILTYEEIFEVSRAAVSCGITRQKITGGEPLVRKGIVSLVEMMKKIPDIEQLTMTTNGVLLSQYASALKNAGLDAVNVSLDTLNPEKFCGITGFDLLNTVLDGIHSAVSAGIRTKINAVLLNNDDEWDELLQIAKNNPVDVRFIELMPIGEAKKFSSVSNADLLAKIRRKYPHLQKDTSFHGNGPASYVKISGFVGSVGFISAIHQKFCRSCNRLRFTSRGELQPCLCSGICIDVKKILRDGDLKNRHKNLVTAISEAIRIKPEAHSFDSLPELRRMFEIGG